MAGRFQKQCDTGLNGDEGAIPWCFMVCSAERVERGAGLQLLIESLCAVGLENKVFWRGWRRGGSWVMRDVCRAEWGADVWVGCVVVQ